MKADSIISPETSNEQKSANSQTPDSSVVCYKEIEVNIGFSGVRKHTSIRCDSKSKRNRDSKT